MKPRTWQTEALAACKNKDPALVEAFPGTGKTIFAALELKRRFKSGEINGLVFVVPTAALKKGIRDDIALAGLQIKDQQKEGRGFPRMYHGIAVCYQQLANLVSTFKQWVKNGRRLAFVFDEIHHASEQNSWGDAVNDCGKIATRTLAMTGTPFRSDGRKIQFVNYDENDTCMPTYSYCYADAIRDGVCRIVEFRDDDGVTRFVDQELHSVRIGETPKHLAGKVSATAFHPKYEFLRRVIAKADRRLSEMRKDDNNAGGLIVCRPGFDANDNRHIEQVAQLVEELTGDPPVVVKHDDLESSDYIDAFRKSRDRWILSVRMISEGIDIPRLRVCVIATATDSELLFRQIVGRVVRVEDGCSNHRSEVFTASFPWLVEFANRIEQEAQAGLKQRETRCPPQSDKEDGGISLPFMSLSASHEDGGGVAGGIRFRADELLAAETERESDPLLRGVSAIVIAQLRRKYGVVSPDLDEKDFVEPEQVKRQKLRKNLNRIIRAYAASEDLEHKIVYRQLFDRIGTKSLEDLCDNMPIEKLHSAIDIATTWFQGGA